MTKPCRGDLYDWHRVGCAGGLGFKIHGVFPDGSLFQTGSIFVETKYGANEQFGDAYGWVETLTWRYHLHGEEHAAPAGN